MMERPKDPRLKQHVSQMPENDLHDTESQHLELSPRRKEKTVLRHDTCTMAEKLDNLSKNTCENDIIVRKLRKDELNYIKRQLNNFSSSDIEKQQSSISKNDARQDRKHFQAKQSGLIPNAKNVAAGVADLSTQIAPLSVFPDSTSKEHEKKESKSNSNQPFLGQNALLDRNTREKVRCYALTLMDMVKVADEKDSATKSKKQMKKQQEQNCTGTLFRVRLDVEKPVLVGEELKLPSVTIQSGDPVNRTSEQHSADATQVEQRTTDTAVFLQHVSLSEDRQFKQSATDDDAYFKKPKQFQEAFSDLRLTEGIELHSTHNSKPGEPFSQVTPVSTTNNKLPPTLTKPSTSSIAHCGKYAEDKKGMFKVQRSVSPRNMTTVTNETLVIFSNKPRHSDAASVVVRQHCQGYRAEPISFLPEPDYVKRNRHSFCKNCEVDKAIPVFGNERIGVDPRPILSLKYQFLLRDRCLNCFLLMKADGNVVQNQSTLRIHTIASCSNTSVLNAVVNNTDFGVNLNTPSLDSKEIIKLPFEAESSSIVKPLANSNATLPNISSNHNIVPPSILGFPSKQQRQVKTIKTNVASILSIRADNTSVVSDEKVIQLAGTSFAVGKSNSPESYSMAVSDLPENSYDNICPMKCVASPISEKSVPQTKQQESVVQVTPCGGSVKHIPEATLSKVERLDALKMKIPCAMPLNNVEKSSIKKCTPSLKVSDATTDKPHHISGRTRPSTTSNIDQSMLESSSVGGPEKSNKDGTYINIHKSFFNDAYSDISDDERNSNNAKEPCDADNAIPVSDIAFLPAQSQDTAEKIIAADVSHFISGNCSSSHLNGSRSMEGTMKIKVDENVLTSCSPPLSSSPSNVTEVLKTITNSFPNECEVTLSKVLEKSNMQVSTIAFPSVTSLVNKHVKWAEPTSRVLSNFQLPTFSKCSNKRNEAFNSSTQFTSHQHKLPNTQAENYLEQQNSSLKEVTTGGRESSQERSCPDWVDDELPILQPKKKRQKISYPPVICTNKPTIGPGRINTNNATAEQVLLHDFVKTQSNQGIKYGSKDVSTVSNASTASSHEQTTTHFKHDDVHCIPQTEANSNAAKLDVGILAQKPSTDIEGESNVLINYSENQDSGLICKSEVKKQCSCIGAKSCLSKNHSLSEVQRDSLEDDLDETSNLQTDHVTSTNESGSKSLKETAVGDELLPEKSAHESSAQIAICDASVDGGNFTCRGEKYAWPYSQPALDEVEAMSDCDSDIEWRSNLENVGVTVTALQDTGFVPKCFLHASADHVCCSCCGALCCASSWVRLSDGTS